MKVPRISQRSTFKQWLTPVQLYREYRQLQHYFGDSVVETHIVSSMQDTDKKYSIIQKEVPNLQPLTREHLKENDSLCDQFAHLLHQNYLMHQQTGYYLPLLGREGAIDTLEGKPTLTNIVIDNSGEHAKLRIIDLGRLTFNPILHAEVRREYDKRNHIHKSFEKWLEDPMHDIAAAFRDSLSMLGNEAALLFFKQTLGEYLQQSD